MQYENYDFRQAKARQTIFRWHQLGLFFCAGYFPVFLLMLKLCKSLGKLLWQEPRYKGTKLFEKLPFAFEVSHIYNFTKGQIISEGNCGVLNFPKKPEIILRIFSTLASKMGQIKTIKACYHAN